MNAPGSNIRPAASLLVLRDGPRGVEVLLMRRPERGDNDFRSGACVFPGGVLDAGDRDAWRWCLGLDDAAASPESRVLSLIEVMRKNKANSLSKTPLSEIWRHPIHTREFGSQITNVLRCLQLEAAGYSVTVTELVGWEHSMKNELIIAKYTGQPRKNARERLQAILTELNLQEMQARFLNG